jgi:hypothetical protein
VAPASTTDDGEAPQRTSIGAGEAGASSAVKEQQCEAAARSQDDEDHQRRVSCSGPAAGARLTSEGGRALGRPWQRSVTTALGAPARLPARKGGGAMSSRRCQRRRPARKLGHVGWPSKPAPVVVKGWPVSSGRRREGFGIGRGAWAASIGGDRRSTRRGTGAAAARSQTTRTGR